MSEPVSGPTGGGVDTGADLDVLAVALRTVLHDAGEAVPVHPADSLLGELRHRSTHRRHTRLALVALLTSLVVASSGLGIVTRQRGAGAGSPTELAGGGPGHRPTSGPATGTPSPGGHDQASGGDSGTPWEDGPAGSVPCAAGSCPSAAGPEGGHPGGGGADGPSGAGSCRAPCPDGPPTGDGVGGSPGVSGPGSPTEPPGAPGGPVTSRPGSPGATPPTSAPAATTTTGPVTTMAPTTRATGPGGGGRPTTTFAPPVRWCGRSAPTGYPATTRFTGDLGCLLDAFASGGRATFELVRAEPDYPAHQVVRTFTVVGPGQVTVTEDRTRAAGPPTSVSVRQCRSLGLSGDDQLYTVGDCVDR